VSLYYATVNRYSCADNGSRAPGGDVCRCLRAHHTADKGGRSTVSARRASAMVRISVADTQSRATAPTRLPRLLPLHRFESALRAKYWPAILPIVAYWAAGSVPQLRPQFCDSQRQWIARVVRGRSRRVCRSQVASEHQKGRWSMSRDWHLLPLACKNPKKSSRCTGTGVSG
jgi:hypothetical protein